MASPVEIQNIEVIENPCAFTRPIKLKVTFVCHSPLEDDLEWKLVYVGSASSEEYDQILETLVVGPVTEGTNQFILEAPPPDPSRIPKEDLLGVTICLLHCLYKNNEFCQVGYYVNNELEGGGAGDAASAGAFGEELGEEDSSDEDMMDDGNIASSTENDAPETHDAATTIEDYTKVVRKIDAATPRVTRFVIDWD